MQRNTIDTEGSIDKWGISNLGAFRFGNPVNSAWKSEEKYGNPCLFVFRKAGNLKEII